MKLFLHFFIIIILVGLFFSGFAAAQQDVGWIDDLSGDAAAYRLVRGGTQMKVAVFMSLKNGDEIFVLEEGHHLKIRLADDITALVSKGTSPFVVNSKTKTPTLVKNLVQWAGEIVAQFYSSSNDNSSIEMRIRGENSGVKEPLWPAYWEEEQFTLKAGRRRLAVSWRGGEEPFFVKLYGINNEGEQQFLFQRENITSERIWTDEIQLLEGGTYRLVVGDKGEAWEFPIVVLPAGKMPVEEEIFAGHDATEPSRQAMYAIWLIRTHPDWTFEAYQILANAAETYPPAQVLRNALEGGKPNPQRTYR